MAPPSYRRYSLVPPRPASIQGQTEALPAYTRRNTIMPARAPREPMEHTFSLADGRSSWATLRLRSSAKSAKSLPTFYERENLNGILEIDADKADSIHSVSAVVSGKVLSANSDVFEFLNFTTPIWSKSPDHPRLPSSSQGTSGTKLRGRCSWELGIPLPREVDVNGRMSGLPETFTDRGVGLTVQYELVIKIGRGKLRSDSRISTLFGYVPSTRPEPASPLRQMAYQENSPLPGPFVDPQGWMVGRPTVIRGTLFNSRPAEVKISVFLASPLSYTRGSVLPTYAVIESSQSQLLDLLCSPEALPLHLERKVDFSCKSSSPIPVMSTTGTPVGYYPTGERGVGVAMSSAVWWRSPSQAASPHIRHMEGEIRLPKDLRPNASLGPFVLSYNVVLGPLNITGFTPSKYEGVFNQDVTIVTKYARGPQPLAYSPPGYQNMRSISP